MYKLSVIPNNKDVFHKAAINCIMLSGDYVQANKSNIRAIKPSLSRKQRC